MAGLLKRIGEFHPESFGTSFLERLRVQKLVYLMQHAFGIDLGYPYNWYIHGPYSPDLARDAFALVSEYDSVPAQRFKDVALEEKFEAFKEFVKSHEQDYDWLAIAASLLYLYRNKSNDQTYIFRTLSAKGLPEIRFVEVWKHLEKWGLVS